MIELSAWWLGIFVIAIGTILFTFGASKFNKTAEMGSGDAMGVIFLTLFSGIYTLIAVILFVFAHGYVSLV